MSTHADTLARTYALSLFELCEQSGGRDAIMEAADELEQVCELARSDAMFNEFLNSPLIEMERRAGSIKAIFEGQLTDLVLRFLLVRNANERLGHLEAIETAYSEAVHEHWGRVEVDVTTAKPMDDQTRESVTRQLQGAIGQEPVLHAHVNPDIIGGVMFRIGDQLVDGSVATQLRRLNNDLQRTGGHEIRLHPDRFLGDSA